MFSTPKPLNAARVMIVWLSNSSTILNGGRLEDWGGVKSWRRRETIRQASSEMRSRTVEATRCIAVSVALTLSGVCASNMTVSRACSRAGSDASEPSIITALFHVSRSGCSKVGNTAVPANPASVVSRCKTLRSKRTIPSVRST